MFKAIVVKDQASIADTDTDYSCKLPKALIAALYVIISGTGGSGAALAYSMVTKVKIDADKHGKMLELSADQLVRRAGIKHGTPFAVQNNNGAYSQIAFPIYAGNRPRDTRAMYDLKKCSKRAFELTFDAVLFNATTRFTTGTIKITIVAIVWAGAKPAGYRGYIKQEQAVSRATGTGDLKIEDDMPLDKRGHYVDVDITVSDVTSVENVLWTGNSETLQLINEHFRANLLRVNYERDLSAALTLNGFWDWSFINKSRDQFRDLPNCDKISDTTLVIERGATTTTVVICTGILVAPKA